MCFCIKSVHSVNWGKTAEFECKGNICYFTFLLFDRLKIETTKKKENPLTKDHQSNIFYDIIKNAFLQ